MEGSEALAPQLASRARGTVSTYRTVDSSHRPPRGPDDERPARGSVKVINANAVYLISAREHLSGGLRCDAAAAHDWDPN